MVAAAMFLKAYFVAGSGVSFNPFNNLRDRSDYPYHPDEETAVHRDLVTSSSE